MKKCLKMCLCVCVWLPCMGVCMYVCVKIYKLFTKKEDLQNREKSKKLSKVLFENDLNVSWIDSHERRFGEEKSNFCAKIRRKDEK